MFAARALTAILRDGLAFEGAARIKHRLRRALFERCVALGPNWARRQRSGQVSHLLADAIEAMDRYYRDYLPQMMLAAVLPDCFLSATILSKKGLHATTRH